MDELPPAELVLEEDFDQVDEIQAAIAALHASAPSPETTDWLQIAGLYAALRRYNDSAIIRLDQAVAVSIAGSPAAGLRLLELLSDDLSSYAPYHLARADTLCRLDQIEVAGEAYQAAMDLTQNEVERDFIRERIAKNHRNNDSKNA